MYKVNKRILAIILMLTILATSISTGASITAQASITKKELSKIYLNTSVKYLHVKGETKNNYTFKVKKGAKHTWYVKTDKGNPDSVVVNKKTGLVTAKNAGTAYVRCKVTLADGSILRPEAKVVVRNNIKEVEIKNIPKDSTIIAGKEYDFDRTILNTDAGKGKKTQGKTRWEIKDDTTGVGTATDKGVVLPMEAGTFKIRAVSFQSNAKYKKWLTNKNKYKEYITAKSDWATISVDKIIDEEIVTPTPEPTIPVIPVIPVIPEIPIPSVKVSAITVTGAEGATTITTDKGTLQMKATVTPEEASNKAVTWSVDDTSKATINASGLLTAVANGTVKVTATAKDGSGVVGAVTIIVSNQVVTPTKYAVTVTNGTGNGNFAEGATVTITANAADSGKVFDKWTSSDGVSFTDANAAITSFTMPAKAVAVEATYKDAPVTNYTVTVSNDGNGTGTANPATAEAGTEITLAATANSGYQFKEWQVVSGEITISSDKFTMPAGNVEVKAIFEALPPVISGVTISPKTTSVQKGTSATFSAVVTGTGAFDSTVTWSVSGGISGTNIDNNGKLTVDASETATTITVTATANGDSSKSDSATVTITDAPITKYAVTVTSGTGNGNFAEGATVTITANAADSGKVFDKWTSSDGVSFTDANAAITSFTMPAKAVAVEATYKDAPVTNYTVTVSNDGNGTGTANPATAEAGTEITLAATANSGYQFKEWQVVSGEITISSDKFTMPAGNVEVKAIFEALPPVISGVTISPKTTSVQKGTSATFSAVVTGTGAFDSTVTWSVLGGISGTNIDNNGKLTVDASETATTITVTATAKGDSSKSDSATVTITDAPITKYAVTVTNGTGNGNFAEGATVSITANAPVAGKVFDKWTSSDGVSFTDANAAITSFTMPAKAVAVEATYKDAPVITYTVTVSNDGNGTGTANPATAEAGTEITLSATANSGYQFKEWQVVSGEITISSNKFTMPAGNVEVKAIFEALPPVISGVTISPKTTSVQKGTSATFSAVVTGTGAFDSTVTWSVSGGISGTNIDNNGKLTVDASETATTITVTATAKGDSSKSDSATVTITDAPITKYAVTVTNGTGNGNFAEGATVSITANAPVAGKVFDKWTSSDGVSFTDANAAITSFTMPAKAVAVEATYKDAPVITYTVTVSNDGNGTGTANPATAEAGTEITLSATANSGYQFKEWQVLSGGVTISSDKFTMPAGNVEVKAIFEEIFVPVTDITGVATTGTVGVELILSGTVDPANATNKTITWGLKSGSATVTDDKVTASAAGDIVVTATITNGIAIGTDYIKDFTITITAATVPVTGVTLDVATLNLTAGGATGTLVATVNPTEATNKNVTWSSDNTAVATVANGVVTSVAAGTATITVKTVDGGYQATCLVTVSAATDTKITLAEIPGVTAPVTGAIPDVTAIGATQYTGTIAWTLDDAPFDTPFAAEKKYTATITLTAKSGYTLVGVGADFFTVDGATTTNAENDGVVTAVFSTTETVANNIKILGTDDTEYSLNNLPKGLSWDGSILTMDNFQGKYIRQGSHATDLKEITINVVGDANKLTAGSKEALLFDSGITIQGTGTLTLESKHTGRAVSHNTTIQGSAKVTINIDKSTKRAVFGNVTVKDSGKLEVNTVGEDVVGSSITVADNIYLEKSADIKLNLTNGISTQSYASIASNIPYIEGKYNNTGKYYEKAAYKVVGEWNATNGGYAGGENQIKLTYTVPNSVDKLYTSGGDENSDIYMKIWAPSTSSPSITMYNNAEFTGGGVTSIELSTEYDNVIYVKTTIGKEPNKDTKYYIITIIRDKAGVAEILADKAALTAGSIRGANIDLDNIKVALKNPLPSKGSVNNSTITWTSDKPAIVSHNGQIIKRPNIGDGSKTVTLTATLTRDGLTETKDFVLTVLELEPSTIEFAVAGPITKTLGDPEFTNGVSGDGEGAITYSSGTPEVATVDSSSGEVTIVGVGTTVITASKAATATHAAVTNSYTVQVSQQALGGTITIDGELKFGEKLTANISSLTGNSDSSKLSYTWKRGDTTIGSNQTYTTVADDIGKTITVEVTSSVETGTITGTTTETIGKANGPVAPIVVGATSDEANEILVVGGEEKITVTIGTNMTADYEYSLDGGTIWKDLTDGDITGLTSSITSIQIRVKETTTHEAGVAATCDVTVAAESFTLTYIAGTGGTITGTSPQTVSSGGDGTTVTAVANEGYSFDKWSDDLATAERTDTSVTANITVEAQFKINEYTVTFKDHDDSVLKTETVEHGSDATAPADPTRSGYTFTGWDNTFTNVTGDLTVTAQYTKDIVPVTNIAGVPTNGTVGSKIDLTVASVAPLDATNKTIVWSVKDAGATEVTTSNLSTGKFTPSAAGTLQLMATITNGLAESSDYTQDFTITIATAGTQADSFTATLANVSATIDTEVTAAELEAGITNLPSDASTDAAAFTPDAKGDVTKDIEITFSDGSKKTVTVKVKVDRIKITEIKATSSDFGPPVFGEQANTDANLPKFTISEGSPAYFNTNNTSNAYWMKKDGDNFKKYGSEPFTAGTYIFRSQVRIDDDGALKYKLASPLNVTVGKDVWLKNGTPSVSDTYSYASVSSPEYVITAPAYASTTALTKATVTVANGTILEDAKAALDATVGVVGAKGETGTATIAWTIAAYDGDVAGDYTATGVLTLPAGWTGTAENVTATVTVEAAPDAVVDALALDSLVTAPVKHAAPDTTAIDATQYSGTIEWLEIDGSTPVTGNFAASKAYVAKVTLTAKEGYTLTGVKENSFTYMEASVVNAADAGVVRITFPATEAKVASTVAFTEVEPISKLTTDGPFTNAATGAGDGAITYSSSNEAVATVDANTGEVTIVGAGSAVITASQAESDTHLAGTATYTLNVTAPKTASTIAFAEAGPISKLTTDGPFTNAATGDGEGAITYSSSNEAVATVDANTGEVTIVGAGSAVITASQAESDTHLAGTATYTLNVTAPKSDAKAITETTVGTLDGGNIINVPAETKVSALKAGLTVSDKAAVEILDGTGGSAVTDQATTDVTATMVIQVTAEDGSKAEYTITMA